MRNSHEDQSVAFFLTIAPPLALCPILNSIDINKGYHPLYRELSSKVCSLCLEFFRLSIRQISLSF